ncbi:MAG TPA: type II toxin-antitoxin system prevent-host-death family antitoxin [Chloroflexota bacterium]|nr:type II toxin-antitoxin system prevent-host-death family antitoxin [Chloroflexota bacterium]
MATVSIRDLRNHGGEVIDRVIAGEHITITRNGREVAELRPVRRAKVPMATVLERWRELEPVDPVRFRADIDSIFDSSL